MECALLLDVVISQGPAVLELFARKDQSLLVGRNPLLVLYLRLYVFDSITWLHIKSDCLTRQSLDKYLHRILVYMRQRFKLWRWF